MRTRLHALWLLRQPAAGWPPTTVAAALGGQRSTVQLWLRWYREGGLAEVCRRRQPSFPTLEQQAARLRRDITAKVVPNSSCGFFRPPLLVVKVGIGEQHVLTHCAIDLKLVSNRQYSGDCFVL